MDVWVDVLVRSEQILRIIFGRQRGQTREFLLAIRGTQAAFAVILAEEIYA